MIRFEDIQEKAESYLPKADLDLLRKAYVFSAKEHKGQTRSSGEPYLTHPLSVAYELAELKLRSGLPMDALEALSQAAQLEPGRGTALIRIGEILIELGHGAEAVAPLEAFVQQNPYDVRGITTLVGALNLAQRGDDALRTRLRITIALHGRYSPV